MPASNQLIDIIAQQIDTQIDLIASYPDLEKKIEENEPQLLVSSEKRSVDVDVMDGLNQTEKAKKVLVSTEISIEEKQSIFDKLSQISLQPVGKISEIDLLYFEQQLSDMLGITVTAELDGHQLPFTIAQAEALAHFRSSPTDSLDQHANVLEAGLSISRPSMGFINSNQRDKEQFAVSLPLMALPDWATNRKEILSWFKHKSVMVINPSQKKAAIGSVIDTGPAYHNRVQAGLSPELIRALQVWHPLSRGKVIILFVDSNKKVKLGPIKL